MSIRRLLKDIRDELRLANELHAETRNELTKMNRISTEDRQMRLAEDQGVHPDDFTF